MLSLHAVTAATMLALAPIVPTAVSAQQTSEAAPTISEVDEFAEAAARNSLIEVLMSAMALQKTGDKRVEDHAWTMLDHHSRAMGDLAEALSPDAALLPSEPGDDQTATLEEMRSLEGPEFDEAYLTHQVDAHERAIDVFEQGEQVPDEQVAQYASTTLPVLRAHLEITRMRHAQAPQPVSGE